MVTRNVRILLQARSSSTRLPGKVLMPISGIPIVLLAAYRASRSGGDLVVVTSAEETDDELARVIEAAHVQCFRGPLNDVLLRFVMATEDLNDDDLCIRITSDNVVPDAAFLELLEEAMLKNDVEYLSSMDFAGPPLSHGLSAEIFTVRALRSANADAVLDFHREHVTPLMRERRSQITISRPAEANPLHNLFPCTIDTSEEYLRMSKLFELVEDPIREPWFSVMSKLAN